VFQAQAKLGPAKGQTVAVKVIDKKKVGLCEPYLPKKEI